MATEEGFLDENVLDSVLFRLDFLRSTLIRYQSTEDSNSLMGASELNELLELLEAAANTLSTRSEIGSSCRDVSHVFTGNRGRPRYEIPKNHLESLLDLGFSVPLISTLLNVSTRTIERRMTGFGLSIRDRFSSISDANLDLQISQILREFPNIGYSRVTGHLRARGLKVQRERIRQSMRRVNPEGVWT